MNKKDICIVIPIYKDCLNEYEIQSVEQCVKVLSEYSIFFVAPNGLNLDFYKSKFKTIQNYFFFEELYFKDVAGYNRLMLSTFFYEKFLDYEYMLIYQTDCYVFSDELLDWTNKGYDYMGGIWFEEYIGNPNLGAKIWLAGNGGLSLRKIKSISRMLSSKKPVKSFSVLLAETKRLKNRGRIIFLKGLFLLPFNVFGYENNINYLSKKYLSNEDCFIVEKGLEFKSFNLPNAVEVISFSWDRHPAYLFNKLGKLPFACHAWFRNDSVYEGNKEFWIDIIYKNA